MKRSYDNENKYFIIINKIIYNIKIKIKRIDM